MPQSPQYITDPHWGLPSSTVGRRDEIADPNWGLSSVEKPDTALSAFARGAWNTVNPIPMVKGLFASMTKAHQGGADLQLSAIIALRELGVQAGKAQLNQFVKGFESFKAGNVSEAVGYTLAGLMPLVGPAAANAGEMIGEGRIAEGLGAGAALLAPGVMKYGKEVVQTRAILPTPARVAASKPLSIRAPAVLKNRNPLEQSAVEFGQAEGIPVDLATASGSPVVRGAQFLADRTIAGDVVARRARQAQSESLTEVGHRLASEASRKASVPETAGAAVTAEIEQVISTLKLEADTAYDAFRTAAKHPRNQVTIQLGTKTVETGILDAQGVPISKKVPITQQVSMPVDMRAIKKLLQPLYNEMSQWIEPAKLDASAGFKAIGSILKGDDFLPATVAEKGLSGLKTLARGAESADLRNISQGIAARTSQQLQSAIASAATKAGPEVLKALQEGRAAHASKMQAADVLGQLRDEPVQVFNQATFRGDAGIDKLRAVAQLAPKAIPKIGRAFIENALETATAEGGFGRAQGLWSKWQNLGPQTKTLLFGQPLTMRLNQFFFLAKKAAENPNPSGTGFITSIGAQGALMVSMPWKAVPIEIGAGVLAKAMRSPTVIRLLTKGFSVTAKNRVAAAALADELMTAVGREGIDLRAPVMASPGNAPPRQDERQGYVSEAQDRQQRDQYDPGIEDLARHARGPVNQPGAPVHDASIPQALNNVGPGRHTLSDGSVWDKRADGSIVRVR